MSYKNKEINKSRVNKILIIALLLTAIMSAAFFLYNKNSKSSNRLGDEDNAQTTSTLPSAQSNFDSGEDRQVGNTNQDKGQAGISDNQGNVPNISDNSTWTTSRTGQITIYQPANGRLLKSGDNVSGESSLEQVSYRIIDNVSGVLSEGKLEVLNGKFSGNITFNTTASEGRLDIFGINSDDIEISNTEVLVKLK